MRLNEYMDAKYDDREHGHYAAGGCHASMIVLCLAMIVFLFSFTSAPASAHIVAGNGRITGQLLDGTKNKAPLAGQTVTLQEAQGNNAQDMGTAKTDAHGSYTFDNLATNKTISYAVYIRYQGAQYVSDVVSLDSKPVQQLNLTVYEATTSTAKIALLDGTILVHEPDVQKGTISVSEILYFRNLDSHTYVGSFDTSKGKPNALRFSLPGNAKSVALGTGFDGYHTVQVDLGFATDAALPPGDTQFSFSFQVPYSASTYDFTYASAYPTVQLSFLVPPDIHVNAGILTSGGVTTNADHPYRIFKATALLGNDEIHVGLEGLPTPGNATSTKPLNTSNIWLVVGGLLLLAIIVVTGYLYSVNRHKAATRQGRRGKPSVTSSKTIKPVKDAVLSTPKDKKEALLQELLNLDKSFESGKLSKAVYQERRAKTKARLRTIMSEQEASRR